MKPPYENILYYAKICQRDYSKNLKKRFIVLCQKIVVVKIYVCFYSCHRLVSVQKLQGELKNVSAIHYCSFGEKSVLRQALHKLHLTTYNGMYFTKVTYITPMIKYIDTLHISNKTQIFHSNEYRNTKIITSVIVHQKI